MKNSPHVHVRLFHGNTFFIFAMPFKTCYRFYRANFVEWHDGMWFVRESVSPYHFTQSPDVFVLAMHDWK